MSDEPLPTGAVKVFFSYSHKDEELRDSLETHLALLRRQGVVSNWHDRRITAGREWEGEIDEQMKTADIILLLVSADFLASDYCYDVELGQAMRQHEAKKSRVIPIILRPCDLTGAPFGKLNSLPKDRVPVTKWPNRDDAFTDIANGIRRAAKEIIGEPRADEAASAVTKETENAQAAGVESRAASIIPRPPVVGFVARRDEQGRDIVERLTEELAPGKGQLVSLWGPGGIGKTTLAAEVVRATEGVFRGRAVWASSLRRTDFNFAALLDEVATQLGHSNLRTLALGPKATAVVALVCKPPALVVLDNFETIAAEEQVRCLDFLAQGVACPALITTRSLINRDDVNNVPLAAMSLEEARNFLGRLVERTRKPANFAKLDRDDLISRCEANPLVLQWVVRQIDLAKMPQAVLDDLARGEGDAAQRVFDRSFNLPQVGEDGRDTLLALSFFTTHASSEALAEVAGFGGDSRRLGKAVEGLSALWLVETTEGNNRLFLRGLTRELSKSRMSKDARADEFRRRYFTYFLRHVDAHQQGTPKDLDALEAEKDNILGAIDVAVGLRDWEGVMHVSAALAKFLHLRGHWDEAIRSGEQAQVAACELKNEAKVARFKAGVGMIRWRRGQYEEARRLCEEALEISRRLKGKKSIAVCLHRLGMIAKDQGDLEKARKLCEESLEISKELKDHSYIGLTVWGLGNIALNQHHLDEAKGLLNQSLTIFTNLKDQASTAGVLHQLAVVAREQGETGEAQRLYRSSLEVANTLGHQNVIGSASRNLGLIAEENGDKKGAALLFQEALHIFEKLGSPEAKKVRRDLARVEGESD